MGGGEARILVTDLAFAETAGDLPDPEVGQALIEEITASWHHVRVVVLSAFGGRETLRARLIDAGVRIIDVVDKAAGRDECRAALLAALQRAAGELWRSARRGGAWGGMHRVVRHEPALIEIDGHRIARLSPVEAEVLSVLFDHGNQPVDAKVLEPQFTSTQPWSLTKVHSTISRLRTKIDRAVGRSGVGHSVIRTYHQGVINSYKLNGLLIDMASLADANRTGD
jgi:hypothetical protein